MAYKKYKISTDNVPLLDDLVHYLKRLITESVIKQQKRADEFEGNQAAVESYRYLCAVDNSADFYLYTYRRNEFIDAGLPPPLADKATVDLSAVPTNYRKILLENKKAEIIEFYEELNPYYRMLNGLPEDPEDFIFVNPSIIPDNVTISNNDVPIHLYTDIECDLLYHYGVIDTLKTMYPQCKYLDYLGSRRISIYNARKAGNFELLYMPSDIPIEIANRFRDKLALNRTYIETVVYSEAYEFRSPYYEPFLAALLMVLTMTDVISEMPDMINKNEIFDLKMVKLIFDNYDVQFFNEIPFNYQLAMVKNLHKLIKYKSTTINIIDICSIFGFDNIKVFKYYLLKERKMVDGKYTFELNDDFEFDNDKNFDLKFIKVPITEDVRPYLNDPTHHLNYDKVTTLDGLWDGGLNHDDVKRAILNLEFNHYYTKYMSVEVLNSMSKLSFQIGYFYSLLIDDHEAENGLVVNVPELSNSNSFKVLDLISLLFALGYRFRGVKDNILGYKQTKVAKVLGFNMDADMNLLAQKLKEKGYTPRDLGIDDWQNPSSVYTIKQLLDIYMRNKKIHDHLVKMMDNAENKREFDVYKMVYDSLMITEITHKAFERADGTLPETFTDYIKDRTPELYRTILDIDSINDQNERKSVISQTINAIVNALNNYIYSDELDNVFSIFPSINKDSITHYVRTVIGFFKSYKIDIESVNSILKFDSTIFNKIRIIDDMFVSTNLTLKDNVDILDKVLGSVSNFIIREGLKEEDKFVKDFAYIVSTLIRYLVFEEHINIVDEINKFKVQFKISDDATVDDGVLYKSVYNFSSFNEVYDVMKTMSEFSYLDNIRIREDVRVIEFIYKRMYINENITTNDVPYSMSTLVFRDYVEINDEFTINSDI